jgi:hypothetical protein
LINVQYEVTWSWGKQMNSEEVEVEEVEAGRGITVALRRPEQ